LWRARAEIGKHRPGESDAVLSVPVPGHLFEFREGNEEPEVTLHAVRERWGERGID
jgi:hypothetical protein